MPRIRTFLALAATAMIAQPLAAQDATTAEQAAPESQYPELYSPSWSDNDMARIASQLSGYWSSAAPIESGRNEDGSVATNELLISIQPVPVQGLSDTMYVESTMSDTPWAPYRQAIFQLYRYKGKVRLRTYEFTIGDVSLGAFSSMGAVPEYFPELSASQLIATMDVELEPTENGFTGSSPYPYPTGAGGAVEMTSSLTLDGDTLSTADRGYDAEGKVVWGAGVNGSYTFNRTEPYITAERNDNGMAILRMGDKSDMVVESGDRMSVHYSGYLTNGDRFDSSSIRGIPYTFTYPPGQGAITGWGLGMDGLAKDEHAKLVIPGYLGYAERGNPRANIPPDATLIFDIHLADLVRPEPAPVEDAVDHSGHDHSDHSGHDH
jgi:hypothetical protein